jgi:hypothetical protein
MVIVTCAPAGQQGEPKPGAVAVNTRLKGVQVQPGLSEVVQFADVAAHWKTRLKPEQPVPPQFKMMFKVSTPQTLVIAPLTHAIPFHVSG